MWIAFYIVQFSRGRVRMLTTGSKENLGMLMWIAFYIVQFSRGRVRMLTIGSGASSSLHITQGTPVPISTAILAAQFT